MKINIKKQDTKLFIRVLIIIILIILSILTIFKAGRKFYNLKSTILDNKKVEYKGKIARWNFGVKIKNKSEEIIAEEEKVYNYKYIIHAYKLNLVQEGNKANKGKQYKIPNSIKSENKNIDGNNIQEEKQKEYTQKDNTEKENKDTFVIIKR